MNECLNGGHVNGAQSSHSKTAIVTYKSIFVAVLDQVFNNMTFSLTLFTFKHQHFWQVDGLKIKINKSDAAVLNVNWFYLTPFEFCSGAL